MTAGWGETVSPVASSDATRQISATDISTVACEYFVMRFVVVVLRFISALVLMCTILDTGLGTVLFLVCFSIAARNRLLLAYHNVYVFFGQLAITLSARSHSCLVSLIFFQVFW